LQPMDEFSKIAETLIAGLELAIPGGGGTEEGALAHLKKLMQAVESRNRKQMDMNFMELKGYWLESVPWCSGLSKEIEKLLMIYEQTVHIKR